MLEKVFDITLNSLKESYIDLDYFVRNESVRKMYLDRYRVKVAMKKWKAIEELTKEEKIYYWNEAGTFTQDQDLRIEMVKVIYTIEKMIG
jgi:hypothetical protein